MLDDLVDAPERRVLVLRDLGDARYRLVEAQPHEPVPLGDVHLAQHGPGGMGPPGPADGTRTHRPSKA